MPVLNKEQNFDVDESMVSNVQKHLDAVPDVTEEDLADIPQREKKDVKNEDDEPIKKEETELEEEDDDVDELEEKDDDVDADDKDKDKPALPDNYFRAAIHSDWTPEDIQEFFDADPEKALKTFKKIYDSTNATTQLFAEYGRISQKQTQDALKAEQDKKDAEADEFKDIDVDTFEKKFGEENPAAVAILKAMNEQNKLLHGEIVELRKSHKSSTKAGLSDEDNKTLNDVENFFNDGDLEAYNDFYGVVKKGKLWNQVLTGEQMQHRYDVCVMADENKAGAKLRGTEMDRSEALLRAHLYVSRDIRDTVIRNGLKGKLKRRSKGITVKSTGRKPKDSETSGKKSEKKVENRMRKRLRRVWPGSSVE